MSANNLFEVLRSKEQLPSHINNATDLLRVVLDIYAVHISISKWDYDPKKLILSLRRYRLARRPAHTRGAVDFNYLLDVYENRLLDFFNFHPNGIRLSQFHSVFYNHFDFVPQFDSIIELCSKLGVFAFEFIPPPAEDSSSAKEGRYIGGENPDLLLLRMKSRKEKDSEMFRYPSEGLILDGLPSTTSIEDLESLMKSYFGDCRVLRRGAHRTIVWFADEKAAQKAKEQMGNPSVSTMGVSITPNSSQELYSLKAPKGCSIRTFVDEKHLYTPV